MHVAAPDNLHTQGFFQEPADSRRREAVSPDAAGSSGWRFLAHCACRVHRFRRLRISSVRTAAQPAAASSPESALSMVLLQAAPPVPRAPLDHTSTPQVWACEYMMNRHSPLLVDVLWPRVCSCVLGSVAEFTINVHQIFRK
jgi:hypothetical protein